MAAAYFIKFDRPFGEAHTSFRCEALAREVTDLNWTAIEMGLRPLSEFCSPQFFSADDGVRTVQALFREIAAWSPGVKETADILRDLKECERILSAAAECGVRFHFLNGKWGHPLEYLVKRQNVSVPKIVHHFTVWALYCGLGRYSNG